MENTTRKREKALFFFFKTTFYQLLIFCKKQKLCLKIQIYQLLFLPIIFITVVPLLCVFYFVRNTYVSSSRILKRLDGSTRSPIFDQFNILLNGISITAFYRKKKATSKVAKKMGKNVAKNDKSEICFRVPET